MTRIVPALNRAQRSAKRNLNPHKWAVAAMWLFSRDYSIQHGGTMDFWDSLPESRKQLTKEMLAAIERAPDAP